MDKVTPCLWFDSEAEEAARFYTSLFKDAKIHEVSRFGEGGPRPAGTVLTVVFSLGGRTFTALNGGPAFKFNESVSLQVSCRDQREVDRLWSRLTADGGEESMCGWLKDKYGLSWQIIPEALPRLLADPDPERAQRAMQAMLKMRKIDIAVLRRAADGAEPARRATRKRPAPKERKR